MAERLVVNVSVENLAPCRKLVRVEIDAQEVDKAFEDMTRNFQRQVNIPGFRPGKAPRALVEKRYADDIKKEVKRKLIPDAYHKVVKEQDIDVIGHPDIEEIQFDRGQPLQFVATVETAPEFELPEYKGIPVKREKAAVTDADVERAIEALRERRVDYKQVERPVRQNDIAIVHYTGTCEGKPITDLAPAARGLAEQKNFWVQATGTSFIPGFADQLIGACAGEKRTVHVDFPAEFVTPELAGKKGVYEVEVVEVREKILPEINDEFAKSYDAEDLGKLREGVRKDLENELKFKQDRETRGQVVGGLLSRVTFDLPESFVMQETRNVVFNLVKENQQRGIPGEVIDQQKEQIFSAANTTAKDRIKAIFLFQKIADREGIKVDQNELATRIHNLAVGYQMPPDKFLKELQKRNGVPEVHEQLLAEKVIGFLIQNATVEEVEPRPKAEAPGHPAP